MHGTIRVASGLLGLGLAIGCGSPDAPGTSGCPNDLPAACPSPAPTYADVAPVLAKHCTKCHGPGGVEAAHALDTYARVYQLRSPVLNQIYACVMPLAGEPKLAGTDRELLLDWLVCGAPQ